MSKTFNPNQSINNEQKATEKPPKKKKKIVAITAIILIVLIVIVAIVINNLNSDYETDFAFRYNLKADDTYEVLGLQSWKEDEGTDIVIPKTFKDKAVTSIGEYAFSRQTELTSITIPDSVVSIGEGAFEDCTAKIVWDGTATALAVGKISFIRCSGLTSLPVPLSSIGEEAFFDCSGLTSVTLSEGLTSIPERAFSSCASLNEIVIPSGSALTIIDKKAFKGCEALTAFSVSKNIQDIGEEAFNGCSALKTLTFAEGSKLKTIGKSAFGGTAITSVNLPDGIVDLYGFAGSSIKTVLIPASVTSISFSECSALETITFAADSQLTKLDFKDFSNCSSLTSIRIPASITQISWYTFVGCSSLASIEVEEGNTRFISVGNCLIDTEYKCLVRGCSNSVIPTDGSVEEIGAYSFSDYKNLTSITFPSTIKIIENGVFFGCTNLTTIKYKGTKAQWSAIRKETDWKGDAGNLAVKCTDGTINTGE